MSTRPFQTIDSVALAQVAGGATDSSALMMTLMMTMMNRPQPAQAAPQPAQPIACPCGGGGGGGGFNLGSIMGNIGGIAKMFGGKGG